SKSTAPVSPTVMTEASNAASHHIGNGEIAGISVGSTIGFCLLLLGIILVFLRKHRRRGRGQIAETGEQDFHMSYGKYELDGKAHSSNVPQSDINMPAGNIPAMGIPPMVTPVVTEIDSQSARKAELPATRRKP